MLKYKTKQIRGSKPLQKPKRVTDRCRTCMYRTYISSNTLACYYAVIAGQPRGCPPGDECDKYIKGAMVPCAKRRQ
ncbi:MAG: hypothetical protein IKZ08_02965 [Bacteroidales bacterium]|nr:hypothetical protein [Bacteroidales bacterium]